MNSHWLLLSRSESGATTVIVLMAILAMSIAGAALLSSQKNTYAVVQKIESQDIQRDVSDFCVKQAIDVLKAKALLNALPVDATTYPVTITNSDIVSYFFTTQKLTAAAVSSYKQYTQNTTLNCSYKYVKQRPVTGTTTLGEVTQDRSYQSTGNENVYQINAVACNGPMSPTCKSLRTETNFYVGVQ